jgi:hypothetical protein
MTLAVGQWPVYAEPVTSRRGGGTLPNLELIWMPDDHTAGVGTGDPNPVAEVADNDLAVGRIVDSISHSKYWKSSAVFVVEDDTQNGVDHVDGHRWYSAHGWRVPYPGDKTILFPQQVPGRNLPAGYLGD